MSARERIEARFEAYGHWVFRRRFPILLISLAAAVGMASGLRLLRVDISFETFLHPDDPIRLDYNAFRDRFGREDAIVVAIETEDVFDPAFLAKLHAFHAAAVELPHVEDVTSLVNARDTRAEGDTLRVGELLDGWPLAPDALADARARALSNPLFRYNLISPDARTTSVRIDLETYSSLDASEEDVLAGFEEVDTSERVFLTAAETDTFAAALHELLDAYRSPGIELHAAGMSVILYDVAQSLQRDMRRFVGFALLSIAVLLFAFFRRPAGVVLPIVVVVLSVASTIGMMGHFGTPVHLPTQILPSMLLAIGIADAVHILTIFFRVLRGGALREEALAQALGHSALPILMTSLTTAGGLVSFAWAEVAPVAALGLYAPAGVLFALIFSLTLLPALLAIVPSRPMEPADGQRARRLDQTLVLAGDFATRHPRSVLSVTAALCLVAAAGVPRIEFSHDPPRWLAEDNQTRLAVDVIDSKMGGAMTVELLVEGEGEGALRSPAMLADLGRFGDLLESEAHDGLIAGQTVSLADIVKEIHRALNQGRDSHYVVPQSEALVAQELLLFESSGSDDLEDVVDTVYSIGRMSVRLPWHDAIRYVDFLDALHERADRALPGAHAVSIAGSLPIVTRTVHAVIFGVFQSYGIALLIITPLMALLLGSVRLGLYAMVPNLVPLLLTVGTMGWVGLPFDAFTMMTAGIALGLVVDDTIHFLHNFARYHARDGNVSSAVRNTLETAGRAITITSVVLGAGFLVFTLSSMSNLVAFGKVIAFTVTTALLADVLVLPAMMALLVRDRDANA